jgi:hypothetical protein
VRSTRASKDERPLTPVPSPFEACRSRGSPTLEQPLQFYACIF